jgi:hypothetical protein
VAPKLHSVYLPFTEAEFAQHFAPVARRSGPERAALHLKHYRESIARLAAFDAAPKPTGAGAGALTRRARQIEKDERFWVVAALMGVFHAPDQVARLTELLRPAFGDVPPVPGLATWEAALGGKLHLFFEAYLPSPRSYRTWLRDNIDDRTLVPYVREAASAAGLRLEAATRVDAVLLSEESGFAVLFEAKVISDADAKVSFDVLRNQIVRNVDVMLDANPDLQPPLSARKPDRTCFVLLTPGVFKRHPRSRLYGSLLTTYKADPTALADDLPSRGDQGIDWRAVSERLGWVTFEDCQRVVPGACSWLTS